MRRKGIDTKEWTEVETTSFVNALFEELKEQAEKKGLLAEPVLVDKSLPVRILVDEKFVKQTFSSLFAHSVQVTAKGTIFFAVEVERTEDGDSVLRVSVSEGGNGFTEEELELLDEKKDSFEDEFLSRLFTIRKETANRDGDFFVYSVFGGGSVYYMILPCQVVEDVEAEEILKGKDGLHNIESEEKKEENENKWINRELALEYAGGMEEMRLEMLGIYYEQAQQYLKELPELFEAENWEKYRIVVHAIKGNSLGIGAEGFSKEAYEQEMAAKSGNVKQIKAEFATFYEHYQSLIKEVEKSKI